MSKKAEVDSEGRHSIHYRDSFAVAQQDFLSTFGQGVQTLPVGGVGVELPPHIIIEAP
jgi:hypothetical protein